MPKKYFCENLLDLKVCGEEDPVNFSPGRYNRCRKCRNEDVKKHQQKLKEQNIDQKIEDLKDGKKIQLFIESFLLEKELTDGGLTIPEEFFYLKNKIKDLSDNYYKIFKELKNEIDELKLENQVLKEESEKIKKDNLKIIRFLKDRLSFEE